MKCKVRAQNFTRSFIACHCRQLGAANAHNNAKIGSYYDKRKPQLGRDKGIVSEGASVCNSMVTIVKFHGESGEIK